MEKDPRIELFEQQYLSSIDRFIESFPEGARPFAIELTNVVPRKIPSEECVPSEKEVYLRQGIHNNGEHGGILVTCTSVPPDEQGNTKSILTILAEGPSLASIQRKVKAVYYSMLEDTPEQAEEFKAQNPRYLQIGSSI